MSKKIEPKDANCTGLSLMAPVLLKQNEDGAKIDFSIEAYTGAEVERWFGRLAISVDGIKAKSQIPVLLNHDCGQIVGYSTETLSDKSFFVNGKFSEVTEKGKEVKALADEGFPWQASIGVRPIKILSIETGYSETVNGGTVNGPAEVWLESEVFETSFVPLGADGATSVSTFSKFEEKEAPCEDKQKHNKEESLMEITLETLTSEAPGLLAQIKTEAKADGHDEGLKAGIDDERARVSGLMSIEGCDQEARTKAVAEGLSVEAAYKLFFEAEKGKKEAELAALKDNTEDSVGQAGKGKKDAEGDTFMAAVSAYQKENKCNRTEALKAVAKESPDLHAAFLGKGE